MIGAELPAGKQLTVVAYFAGEPKTAYVEPVGIGDKLPSLPIFLDEQIYVPAPLEATYQSTWATLPDVVREFVLTGIA
jgi:BarA-like signal transduction histidine kinase